MKSVKHLLHNDSLSEVVMTSIYFFEYQIKKLLQFINRVKRQTSSAHISLFVHIIPTNDPNDANALARPLPRNRWK